MAAVHHLGQRRRNVAWPTVKHLTKKTFDWIKPTATPIGERSPTPAIGTNGCV
jgi:hypothetical protein